MGASGIGSVAIVAAPKAFSGHAGLIQRNAVASWRALGHDVDILLGGDVAGLDEVAAANGAVPLGPIAPGVDGPPRVDDLLARARSATRADLIAYVNSDIILLPDWLAAVRRVTAAVAGRLLVIGRRIDLDVVSPIDFSDLHARIDLLDRARRAGRLAARVCKDYFVFRRDDYRHVPPFTLGRGFWDNWMVHDAHARGLPVVDVTACATAVHQNHDYAHLSRGRLTAYVTGAGALENRRLARGSCMVGGAAASWRLRPDGGLVRLSLPALAAFAADLPRFVRLTAAVLASGHRRGAGQATFRAGSLPPSAGRARGAAPKMPSPQAA
ncbi:MAG: hypothetical protein EBZ74_03150 [Planctomycetia bacterium]|nr:hypothetical protein [Planctomycetia bacterium]